ncbi:TIMM44 isoform 8 [Pan troglodytes]|uniref:TIMM44 isoform 8 n=1 Tax=Pan troglodytes TaxID=9598 RepID=A0A2J8J6F1_PANTR|nr:TIMM44 isoform 8 [Pan troglodytes]
MAAAALRSGWCRCPRRCLGSGIQFLSSHNLPHGSTYQMRRPGGELLLSKSYSSGNRKGFLSGLLDNVKQELAKNKEMKESIKKFRDEARRLEESDVLQEARRKYENRLNLGGGSCSEPRACHCTPAWATETLSQKKKKKKKDTTLFT